MSTDARARGSVLKGVKNLKINFKFKSLKFLHFVTSKYCFDISSQGRRVASISVSTSENNYSLFFISFENFSFRQCDSVTQEINQIKTGEQ